MMPPQWYQDVNSIVYCGEDYARRNLFTQILPPANGLVETAIDGLHLADAAVIRFGDGYLSISRDGRELGGLVMMHYCMICARGQHITFSRDGEGACAHKNLLNLWLDSQGQVMLFPERDERREAYYEAELYPPNPLH